MNTSRLQWLCVGLAGFLSLPSALRAATDADGWLPLFDGKSLNGWKASDPQPPNA